MLTQQVPEERIKGQAWHRSIPCQAGENRALHGCGSACRRQQPHRPAGSAGRACL